MRNHRKSASTTDLRFQELKLDKIIKECLVAKKEITGNFSKINKQLYSQRSGWRHMENFLKSQQALKSTNGLGVSKEIHEKFKKICDNQLDTRTRKLSKFLVLTKNETISDRELNDTETLKFFLANKRSFGSPVKEILFSPQKKCKVRSCEISINPEETILQDIHAIRAKQYADKRMLIKKKKTFKNKIEKKLNAEENELKYSQMSSKNKLIFREMKKIDPVNSNFFNKRRNLIIENFSRPQKTSSGSNSIIRITRN